MMTTTIASGGDGGEDGNEHDDDDDDGEMTIMSITMTYIEHEADGDNEDSAVSSSPCRWWRRR